MLEKHPPCISPSDPPWKGLDHVLGLPGTPRDTLGHQGSAGSPGYLGASEGVSGWAGPEAAW